MTPNETVRFWTKVDKSQDCWIWTGAKIPEGYGSFQVEGRQQGAHRISYEETKEKIPDGYVLDHLCRNKACVNPNHLEVVTNRTNILRGESMAAQNARKIMCKRGHLLNSDNLTPTGLRKGERNCKKCMRIRDAAYYHKNHPNSPFRKPELMAF